MEKLKSMLEEGKSQTPPINYLVMFLFAGHGMIKEGAQVLLYNEFDKKTGFYKMFKAEEIIRNMAAEFDNSYLMGIFACCRQIFNTDQLEGNYAEDQLENVGQTLKKKVSEYEDKIQKITQNLEALKAK